MEHSSGRKGREYEQQPEWSIVLGGRGGDSKTDPRMSQTTEDVCVNSAVGGLREISHDKPWKCPTQTQCD